MPNSPDSPYADLRLRCGFGRLGLCCTDCLLGPCRLSPFEAQPGQGLCGRDADTIVAHQVARLFVGGLACLLAERAPDAAACPEDRRVVSLMAQVAEPRDSDWRALLRESRDVAGRVASAGSLPQVPNLREVGAAVLPSAAAVAEALRAGEVKGVVLLATEGATPEDTAASKSLVGLAREFLRAEVLCLLVGETAPALSDTPLAHGLGAFLAAQGFPPVLHLGDRLEMYRVLELATQVRDTVATEKTPLVAVFPGLAHPAVAALALGLSACGVAVHTGAALPVGGSAAVREWLATPERYSGAAPLFTATEPPAPRQMVAQLLAWLEGR